MTMPASIASPSAIDRSMVLFLRLFVKFFSTRVPTATAIRNQGQLFGVVSCLPMAPALPTMIAATSVRPRFFLGSSGEPRPASVSVSVVPRAKHNGAARIYCAIEVAVVVLATSMMTVVLANFERGRASFHPVVARITLIRGLTIVHAGKRNALAVA